MKWIYYVFSILLIGLVIWFGKWEAMIIVFTMSFISTTICQVLMLSEFKIAMKTTLPFIGVIVSLAIAIGGYSLANVINPVSGRMFAGLGRAIGVIIVGVINYMVLFPLYLHVLNLIKKNGKASFAYGVLSFLYGAIAFGGGLYILQQAT